MDVALLGPDGLDPHLVERWKSDLPVLRNLIDEGSSGRLRSSHPPLTSPAWPTMYTGKQGGKHGVFGFTKPEKNSYERRAINYSDVQAESLWEALDAEGYSCGVVNVPLTYPPSDLNDGFIISGWPVPKESDITSDQQVLDDLERELGDSYEVNPFPPVAEYEYIDDEDLYGEIKAGLDHHAQAFKCLIETHGADLDMFFGVFNATDVIGHAFAWNKPYMKRLYVRMDEIFRNLLDLLNDDVDIILLSDHGHGVKGKYSFYVNEWLEKNEYLDRSESLTFSTLLKRTGLTAQNVFWLQNKLGLRNAHERLPAPIYEWLADTVPEDAETERELDSTDIEWQNTQIYSPQQNTLQLNTANKPEGCVTDSVYDDLVSRFRREFKAIAHPDPDADRQLISELRHKRDIFEGPFYDEAPDFVFIADEMRCNAPMGFSGEIFTDEEWGEHRKHGILVTHGPSFAETDANHADEITDVFPLVLGLLGASIPENVDGDIPMNRLAVDLDIKYRASRDSAQTSEGYTAEESKEVEEQLKGLGYLE